MITRGSTVIVSGARALAALEIMRALAKAGHRVVATDCVAVPPARWSNAVSGYVRTQSPVFDPQGFGTSVRAIVDSERPSIWIATCEEIFHLAALRANGLSELPLFAPPLRDLLAVHNKYEFAKRASDIGLGPSETHLLRCTDDVAAIAGRAHKMVFKPVWSRFANRVLVRPAAVHLSQLKPTKDDPWIAQAYLPGKEVCTYAIAVNGQVLLHTAYTSRYRAGRHGAGIYFEYVDDPAVRHIVAALISVLNWTGQIAFDLRRDVTGAFKAIECNPRATSGAHLVAHSDLAGAFASTPQAHGPRPARMIGLAMGTYGLGQVWREGGFGAWRDAFMCGGDVVTAAGDRKPSLVQLAFLGEMLVAARRGRCPLIEASTRDIAWNGATGLSGVR